MKKTSPITRTFALAAALGLTTTTHAELTLSEGTIVASFDTGDRNSNSTGDYAVSATPNIDILHTDGLYMTGQVGTWTVITASGNGQNTFGPIVGTNNQSGSDITFTYAAGGEKIQHNNQTTNTPPRASFWRVIGNFGEPPVTFTISGLNSNKSYDLIFYSGGESQAPSGRFCSITIEGETPAPDSDGDSNFMGVVPIGGIISGTFNPSSSAQSSICRLAAVQIAEVTPSGPFRLVIEPSLTVPGAYDFQWGSKSNKVYDLVSTTDPSLDLEDWTIWNELSGIDGTAPSNTLTGIPSDTAEKRFFAVVERTPPAP